MALLGSWSYEVRVMRVIVMRVRVMRITRVSVQLKLFGLFESGSLELLGVLGLDY